VENHCGKISQLNNHIPYEAEIPLPGIYNWKCILPVPEDTLESM
jgi:hypothetical protein